MSVRYCIYTINVSKKNPYFSLSVFIQFIQYYPFSFPLFSSSFFPCSTSILPFSQAETSASLSKDNFLAHQ